MSIKIPNRVYSSIALASLLVGGAALMPNGPDSQPITLSSAQPATDNKPDAAVVSAGREIAFDRRKGNCLACHQIAGGEEPGNIGPPLVAMKSRYSDREKLRSQMWDPTVANPESAMPPFGKHRILSEDDFEKVVDFVWTL